MKQELSKLADILVNHSTKVQPGDQVLIQSVNSKCYGNRSYSSS